MGDMNMRLNAPRRLVVLLFFLLLMCGCTTGFVMRPSHRHQTVLLASKGFGTSSNKQPKKKKRSSLLDTLDDKKPAKQNQGYNKKDQAQLLEQLTRQSATSPIGQVVSEFSDVDPFWELMPSLIASKFPGVAHSELQRVAGFVRQTLSGNPKPPDWVDEPYRPYEDLHAYMPGLGPTRPFHDPDQLEFCRQLQDNYETIHAEYLNLLKREEDRFQSVTSMNYESGWKTLVLFYNGHRIEGFPYHLCPVTTKLLEQVPLAGRIAGFNRQAPHTGIPNHTDGNNMWLTVQMGIDVPGSAASITVADQTKSWENGKCLMYDTTYQHETFNDSDNERVVLHVDFFNVLSMTKPEIEIMRYIYGLREEFLKAEGVAKVGAQIL